MGKTIHGRERDLILKVLKFFEEEKHIRKLVNPRSKMFSPASHETKKYIPIDQAIKRTCAATGVSKATLMRIKKEVKHIAAQSSTSGSEEIKLPTPGKTRRESSKKVNLDGLDLCKLRNIVNRFYTDKKEVPTLKKIVAVAKRDLNFPAGRTTLRRILVNFLGYRFKKCKNAGTVLILKPDLAAWRARYLRCKKENNELGKAKKLVTYLDEMFIHTHDTGRECWKNSSNARVTNKKKPGQSWILVHAGSENGFIPGAELLFKCKTGDNHREMDNGTFIKWLKEKLIPNLPPNGIVVLDNAPYHSMQSEKIPCCSAQKIEMQKCLTRHNITFDKRMTQRELYHLIVLNKTKKNIVDELLQQHGHQVLRLPPNHCDLNPIEYIWKVIKQSVADKNTDQSESQIEELTKDAIQSITREDWKKEIKRVERLEKQYWESDLLQVIRERDLINSFGGEESSESESESDDGDDGPNHTFTKIEIKRDPTDESESDDDGPNHIFTHTAIKTDPMDESESNEIDYDPNHTITKTESMYESEFNDPDHTHKCTFTKTEAMISTYSHTFTKTEPMISSSDDD